MIVIFLAATMLNVEVTQDTVATTICIPHYSSTYRRHHPVRENIAPPGAPLRSAPCGSPQTLTITSEASPR